jgi:hypothetical protein
MDFIYIFDMIRCFTEPYQTGNGYKVTNRRKIGVNYVKTWFICDIYSFYPLAYLRYNSTWDGGSLNPVEMFLE